MQAIDRLHDCLRRSSVAHCRTASTATSRVKSGSSCRRWTGTRTYISRSRRSASERAHPRSRDAWGPRCVTCVRLRPKIGVALLEEQLDLLGARSKARTTMTALRPRAGGQIPKASANERTREPSMRRSRRSDRAACLSAASIAGATIAYPQRVGSDVVVEVELPRVRAELHLVDLVFLLVRDPRVDHVGREHVALQQERRGRLRARRVTRSATRAPAAPSPALRAGGRRGRGRAASAARCGSGCRRGRP